MVDHVDGRSCKRLTLNQVGVQANRRLTKLMFISSFACFPRRPYGFKTVSLFVYLLTLCCRRRCVIGVVLCGGMATYPCLYFSLTNGFLSIFVCQSRLLRRL